MVLHADELSVKRHPQYQAAKSGEITAADLLVAELANQDRVGELRSFLEGHAVELLPIHALESAGVNEIPAAVAKRLFAWLAWVSVRRENVRSAQWEIDPPGNCLLQPVAIGVVVEVTKRSEPSV